MFENQQQRLLNDLEGTHNKFYQRRETTWPGLYFHIKSLEAAQARDFERFAEYGYAMLVSWGMNSNNARMRRFREFRSSLRLVWPNVLQLQEKRPDTLNGGDWSRLKEVFWRIRCMESGTSLVGNSKIMAHLIPNLVPPVDRSYTLTFLYRSKEITNEIDKEWATLEQVLREFFYPMAQSHSFQAKAAIWLAQKDQFWWDTSALKIVDNLVMELSKFKIRTDGKEHTVGDPDCGACYKFKTKPRPHRDLDSASACPGFVHEEPDASAGKPPIKQCGECLTVVI